MATHAATPPESVTKMLSKPGGKKAAQGAGMLLNWANSQRDHVLIQRSLRLMNRIIASLKTALPETNPELIGGICANLLDLWETGQKLDKELKKLTKLRLPQDREQLRDTLIWLDAIQVDMASYWIREVRKDVPKLLRALDQQRRNGRRRVAKKTARKAKNL